MHKSRWGFHACSFGEFAELRTLWRAVLIRRKQVAAWRRWNAKAPHNRVTRERVRDPSGRTVGYTAGTPVPMRVTYNVDCEYAAPIDTGCMRKVHHVLGMTHRRVAVCNAMSLLETGYRAADPKHQVASKIAFWQQDCNDSGILNDDVS